MEVLEPICLFKDVPRQVEKPKLILQQFDGFIVCSSWINYPDFNYSEIST